jgi:hypothetical protein
MRQKFLRKLIANTGHVDDGDEPCPICAALFEANPGRKPDFVIRDEFGETEFYSLDAPDDPSH